jgi:hypothetical protein
MTSEELFSVIIDFAMLSAVKIFTSTNLVAQVWLPQRLATCYLSRQ